MSKEKNNMPEWYKDLDPTRKRKIQHMNTKPYTSEEVESIWIACRDYPRHYIAKHCGRNEKRVADICNTVDREIQANHGKRDHNVFTVATSKLNESLVK